MRGAPTRRPGDRSAAACLFPRGCRRILGMTSARPRGTAGQPPSRRLAEAEVAVLLSASGVLLTALLPGRPVFRAGVVLSALLLFLYDWLWFHVLPPRLFGRARFTAGAVATVAIAAVLLELTGGVESPYFPVYLLSVLASVFALRPGASLATGIAAIIAYLLVFAEVVISEEITRARAFDRAVIGLLALGVVTLFAAGMARSLRRSTDALRQRTEELATLAVTDPLTGLRNRSGLEEQLALVQALAERSGRPYALVALDVDNLKEINDAGGHDAGDRALVAVAGAVRETIRASDIGVRVGGDEFLLVLPETRATDALRVAERLREELRGCQAALGGRAATLSAGVAAWRPGRTSAAVAEAADAMLYAAKAGGRDRVVGEPETEVPAAPA